MFLEKTDEFRIQFRKKHAEANQIELLQGVLGTLSNLCLFDSVGFITDERFQLLLMPVVDQVRIFKIIQVTGNSIHYYFLVGQHDQLRELSIMD